MNRQDGTNSFTTYWFDQTSPILRQVPTLAGFIVALGVTAVIHDAQTIRPAAVTTGIALMVFSTVLAAIFSRTPHRETWNVAVPIIAALSIGVMRAGTGGADSLFGAMLLLPIVWIATEPSRWHVLIATLVSSAALFMPFILTIEPWDAANPVDRWRGIYGPFTLGLAAVTLNELSRRARRQLALLRESEDRLRDADRFSRSVLDAVTEQAVIGTDLDGRIDVWNPGATTMLGLESEKALGQPLERFHVRTELEDRRRALIQAGATVPTLFAAVVGKAVAGGAEVREWTYIRHDGTQLPIEAEATMRLGPNGEPVGYIVVSADMTRAHEAERIKDEFVGMVSHELRTPVSSILGYLELLRDDPLTDDQEQFVGVAERNAQRLLRLVGDLLFTAEVKAGEFSLHKSDLDLADVITSSVESAQPAARRGNVSLQAILPSHSISIHGDAGRLGQALDNLLSNAIKFTSPGGSASVELAQAGDQVRVTVRDSGLGIHPDEIHRLFTPFFRSSTALRNAVPGAGLGLTITKTIVVAHDGTIDVRSEEGVGTAITMNLPLVAAEVAAPS